MKNFKKLSVLALIPTLLTACAYGRFGALDERMGFCCAFVDSDFSKETPNTIGNWKFYSFGRDDSYSNFYYAQYYDVTSPTKKGPLTTFNTYENVSKPQVKDGKSWLSKTSTVAVNCDTKTFSRYNVKYFENKMPTGKPVLINNSNKATNQIPIPDGDTMEKLRQMVCKS